MLNPVVVIPGLPAGTCTCAGPAWQLVDYVSVLVERYVSTLINEDYYYYYYYYCLLYTSDAADE